MNKRFLIASLIMVTTSVKSQIFHVDTSKYAIINFSGYEWKPVKGTPATLNQIEVDEMEPYIIKALNEYNKRLENKNRLGYTKIEYRRQYYAGIDKKGDKVVWVNFFCVYEYVKWRTVPVMVKDGGSCFFNLMINLKTKKVYEISVNGEG